MGNSWKKKGKFNRREQNDRENDERRTAACYERRAIRAPGKKKLIQSYLG